MAQRTIVVKTCDVHGDESPATDTVTFGIGSERFEIDCCAEHAGEIINADRIDSGLGIDGNCIHPAGRCPAGAAIGRPRPDHCPRGRIDRRCRAIVHP